MLQKNNDESMVYEFDKQIFHENDKVRCDYYNPKKPHYRCNSVEAGFKPKLPIGIENFIEARNQL